MAIHGFNEAGARRIVRSVRKTEAADLSKRRIPYGPSRGAFLAAVGIAQVDWTGEYQGQPVPGLKAFKYVWFKVIWSVSQNKYIADPDSDAPKSTVKGNPFARYAINISERREAIHSGMVDGVPGVYIGSGIVPGLMPQAGSWDILPTGPFQIVDMHSGGDAIGGTKFYFSEPPNVYPLCGSQAPTEPVPGACCDSNGECTDGVLPADCIAGGGTPMGPVLCNTIVCPTPQPGACCVDEVCQQVLQGDCTGVWIGGPCTAGLCDEPEPVGACCLFDGDCFQLTPSQCAINSGVYQGDGTPCTPNPCPQPPEETGACCDNFGNCSEVTPGQCNGQFYGIGTTCGDLVGICEPKGACCPPDGLCSPNQTQTQCANNAGVWLGPGSSCAGNPCDNPHTGACCIDGQCFDMTPSACSAAGGTPVPGNCPVFCPGGV